MDGRMDRWVGGWVEKGGSFFTWPCAGGASLSPPLSVSLPQTGCVCDWPGSSCLSWAFWHSSPSCPPPHPPASGCLLPSEGFHLYWRSHSCSSSILCASIYRHCVVSTRHHLSRHLRFSGSFFVFPLFRADLWSVVKNNGAHDTRSDPRSTNRYSVRYSELRTILRFCGRYC